MKKIMFAIAILALPMMVGCRNDVLETEVRQQRKDLTDYQVQTNVHLRKLDTGQQQANTNHQQTNANIEALIVLNQQTLQVLKEGGLTNGGSTPAGEAEGILQKAGELTKTREDLGKTIDKSAKLRGKLSDAEKEMGDIYFAPEELRKLRREVDDLKKHGYPVPTPMPVIPVPPPMPSSVMKGWLKGWEAAQGPEYYAYYQKEWMDYPSSMSAAAKAGTPLVFPCTDGRIVVKFPQYFTRR